MEVQRLVSGHVVPAEGEGTGQALSVFLYVCFEFGS